MSPSSSRASSPSTPLPRPPKNHRQNNSEQPHRIRSFITFSPRASRHRIIYPRPDSACQPTDPHPYYPTTTITANAQKISAAAFVFRIRRNNS
jgi:hypothetical protein